ncbi:hypothetical protein [Streptomyces lycii]|uniref:Uncharacterized protein n=1 Tax=Streptomyces lycii TaxID=2654337 RepID=A0ABQ7FI08_9ACTN|nr:hypothetical protein [Streptomyces lycii]KAF4408631.1 hypothetical protein GCU69_13105 [Streptomyces lycii]
MKQFRDYEGDVWTERADGSYACTPGGPIAECYAELDDDFGPLTPVNAETETIIAGVLEVLADDAEYAYRDSVGESAEINRQIMLRARAAIARLRR